MTAEDTIKKKFKLIANHLNERNKRLWAAAEAKMLGHGGVSLVARAIKISRRAIHIGLHEIKNNKPLPEGRIRKEGAGRHSVEKYLPNIITAIENLIEPLTRGNPMSPLRWTCKSTRKLADELKKEGTSVSHQVVRNILHKIGYSLQANKKTIEGKQHPDRNAQFEYINDKVTKGLRAAQPVISVDTKKKELIGNYANKGGKWCPKGEPVKVNGHDFPGVDVPQVHPYGIYELKRNRGFVNIGTDHDTATFAVASIRKWWIKEGKKNYSKANRILITADAGGSNGSRIRLWKWELQRLSNELKIPISVCHFPPGTSKWNKVEHRLFSFISSNWRGTPLNDYETVVNLISATTTTKGLKVSCRLDTKKYPTGVKISDEDWEQIHIKRDKFHGDWNYTILPN